MTNNLFIFTSKISLLIIFTVFLSIENIYAQPLNAKFYANDLDVKVGDTIYLKLKVNPDPNRPIYTVSATLMYDPSVLSYIESGFTSDYTMLPVPRAPYLLDDTENGMIRRTAGYANGITSLDGFTTYTFKALKPGQTKISIEDGVALDGDNIDIGLQQKQLIINISDEMTDESATSTTPVEVDVRLNLDILGPIAIYKEQSYTFPVDQVPSDNSRDTTVKIYVYNEKTELFYSEEKVFKAYLQEPITFTIPANTLDVGIYVISVEEIDQNGKSEIITQKEIGVLSDNLNIVTRNKNWFTPLFLFIIVVAFIHHIAVERDLYSRISDLNRKRRSKITR